MSSEKPNKPGVHRVTLSLPPSVVEDADAIARMMGLSRSALLSSLLSQTLPLVRATATTLASDLIVQLSDDSDSGLSAGLALQRYSDNSRAAIDGVIDSLMSGGQDDLFKGK